MQNSKKLLSLAASATPPDSGNSEPHRLGKDEMNLVEHPFALLKRSSDAVLLLEWEKRHPRTGKMVQASWRVTGDPELGMPGPTEERLYMVLMELSREQNWPDKVMFSRSDVLSRLGLSRGSGNYALLSKWFLCLKTVTIDARRSFWEAATQDFAVSLQFGILDEVKIVEEPRGRRSGQVPLALSSFTWSRVMQESFAAGNIRSLPIEFALSLELPLAARLFRYLDKHRTGETGTLRHSFEIELHRLCEIHLGMKSAKYPSKLKERLLPALTELRARGFLREWRFETMKSAPGQQKVTFVFANGILPMPDSGPVRLETSMPFAGPLRGIEGPQIIAATSGLKICPQAAYEVYTALDETERLRLRDLARAEVDSAFWDRVERADSPMAFGLWELVVQEHAQAYRDALGE